MLSGATWSAAAIVGTPVLRIVVSSDSMKNATAINHARIHRRNDLPRALRLLVGGQAQAR